MATSLKSPQQYIFDEVFIQSLNLRYKTFDYLPPESAGLPFVFIGEQFSEDVANKTNVHGFVNQTIHIYHDRKRRRELTDMINTLKASIRRMKNAGPYRVRVNSISDQTIFDNSTAETLLHGIIEVEFRFN